MAKIPRDHYRAQACILWCFDNRFWPALADLVKERGFTSFDPVVVAGGAKNLGGPQEEGDRAFVLKQIGLSIKLHQASRVVLMTHEDCGAFGGSAAFAHDSGKEREHHRLVLTAARRAVEERFPGIEVETYFAAFDGLKPV